MKDNWDINKKLFNIIELHERMLGEVLGNVPTTDEAKQRYALNHSLYTEFILNGNYYCIIQQTFCTSKKIHYKLLIYKNGIKLRSDIRIIEQLIPHRIFI